MIADLQELGFTRNEALVYMTALRMGSSSVQQLANATGLNRITVHSIAEKFEGMQIFTRKYEGKRRRISPVDPQHLEFLLRREEQEVQHKKNTLSGILPSLEEMFRQSHRGMRISTFRGERGYEEMCEDVLTAKTEMLEYANIDALNSVIGPYIATDYLPRKHKLQIRTKFLYIDTPGAREYIHKNYVQKPDAAPMQAKFISPQDFPMDSFYVIYDNKLMIFTPKTVEGVIIEDDAIAESIRPFFSFVWEHAGEVMTNQ